MGKGFDEYAPAYDAWFLDNRNVLYSEVNLVASVLKDAGRVLSVGCGSGLFSVSDIHFVGPSVYGHGDRGGLCRSVDGSGGLAPFLQVGQEILFGFAALVFDPTNPQNLLAEHVDTDIAPRVFPLVNYYSTHYQLFFNAGLVNPRVTSKVDTTPLG